MKITRLAVAAATAVSLTLVGAGVAQADTTKEQATTEATATDEASSEDASSEESSSQSSSLSSTDEDVDSDKDGDEAEEQDEFEQLSSQAIEDNAGPFAPLLLAIMPTLGGFFGIIDQLVGFLSLIAGPALNAQYSAK